LRHYRRRVADGYRAGRCCLAFLIWFVGFLLIGGEWFAMWQSATWNGQQFGFRFVACFLLVTVFIMLPEERDVR